MNDIFISYKVHNRAIAIEYYRVLKSKGYAVWFDQFVPMGANWKDTILEQISKSKVILCILSEACLLDDWVKWQLDSAEFLHKQIIYITLDDTNWQEYKDYPIRNRCYKSIEETFNLDPFFKKEEEKVEIDRKPFSEPILDKVSISTWLNPVINIGILSISTILTLLFGIQFFRLSIETIFGYALLGILVLVGLSYIKKWYVYVLMSLGAMALLAVAVYVMPTYYISGISTNGPVFLCFYIFSMFFRYSKLKLPLALLAALLLASLFVALDAAISIFANTLLNLDLYWISFILLGMFLIYIGWNNRKEFNFFKK